MRLNCTGTNRLWIPDRRRIYRIEDSRRIVFDMETLALAKVLKYSARWLLIGDQK